MSDQNSDARRAIKELAGGIQSVFKRYSKTARRSAWEGLTHGGGAELINKLIQSPSKPLVGVERFLRFREWMESNGF